MSRRTDSRFRISAPRNRGIIPAVPRQQPSGATNTDGEAKTCSGVIPECSVAQIFNPVLTLPDGVLNPVLMWWSDRYAESCSRPRERLAPTPPRAAH